LLKHLTIARKFELLGEPVEVQFSVLERELTAFPVLTRTMLKALLRNWSGQEVPPNHAEAVLEGLRTYWLFGRYRSFESKPEVEERINLAGAR
jgi:hypothetical protein